MTVFILFIVLIILFFIYLLFGILFMGYDVIRTNTRVTNSNSIVIVRIKYKGIFDIRKKTMQITTILKRNKITVRQITFRLNDVNIVCKYKDSEKVRYLINNIM